jgi:hypothetical protein
LVEFSMRALSLGSVIAALIWAPAEAQPAGAGAAAEALIREQGMAGVFEPLPNPQARLVRHVQSGLMCLFVNGSRAELRVYPGAARGNDVSCSQQQSNGADLSMFASRISATADEALASAQRSLAGWAWTAPPVPLAREVAASSPFPRAQAAYTGVLRGRPTFVRLAVASTPDGWLIKQRLVVPLDAAKEGEARERLIAESHLMGETIFSETLGAIAAQRAQQR